MSTFARMIEGICRFKTEIKVSQDDGNFPSCPGDFVATENNMPSKIKIQRTFCEGGRRRGGAQTLN
jgi:hypothetical protein